MWDNKIYVIPDVLANAGGVTVSYFEWKQNLMKEKWSKQQVLEKLEPIMRYAFLDIWQTHLEYSVDLRTSAFMSAINRIMQAIKNKKHAN